MDIIICHGTMGSVEGNWFPWLKSEMESRGHNVYVPSFPTPNNQNVDNWCNALRDQTPIFNENTILIGHSISATFLLHVLEVVQMPVHQSIFVSPVMDDIGNKEYDVLNHSFVYHDFDWNKINENKGNAKILHGSNDPYVPLKQAEFLSTKIKTSVWVIENGAHLNSESGYTKFEQLLEIIDC